MIAAVLSATVAAVMVGVVLGVLRTPLLGVLVELCDASDAAQFWWRMVAIEVVVGTTLCASFAVLVAGRADGWRWAAVVVQGSAAGLLVSLCVVMAAVKGFERSRGRTNA